MFSKQGALGGSLISLVLTLWISIGAILYGKRPTILDVGMCTFNETLDGTTQALTSASYMSSTEMTMEPPTE